MLYRCYRAFMVQYQSYDDELNCFIAIFESKESSGFGESIVASCHIDQIKMIFNNCLMSMSTQSLSLPYRLLVCQSHRLRPAEHSASAARTIGHYF